MHMEKFGRKIPLIFVEKLTRTWYYSIIVCRTDRKAAGRMERIKSAFRAVWKTVYPLIIYYMSVFSIDEMASAAGKEPANSVAILIPGAVLTVGILWFPYKRDWILRSGQIRTIKPEIPKRWQDLIVLGIAASVGFNLLLSLTPLFRWFPKVEESVETINSAGFWLQLIGVCLIIPAAEELVFRGIGYWGLRDEMPAVPAAVFSAVFFGLFHGNLVQGIYAAGLGLILAFVMERYQTVTSVWLAHAAMNIGSIYVLNGVLLPMIDHSILLKILVAIFALGVSAAELFKLGRKT